MKRRSEKLYTWATQKALSSKAPLWLGVLFMLELVLFIPLDAVLMFFCMQKKQNIFLYILIATVASTFSGLVGYLLGHFLWDLIGSWVVPHLIGAASFAKMTGHIQVHENWAVFFGSLLPFPLKILSLAAGVFQLGATSFITFLILARLVRFTLVGSTTAIFGSKLKGFVDRNFHRIFMILGAKVAGALIFFWALAR